MLGFSKDREAAKSTVVFQQRNARSSSLRLRKVEPREAVELVAQLPSAHAATIYMGAARPQLRYVPRLDESASQVAVAAVETASARERVVGVAWCQRPQGARVAELHILVEDLEHRVHVGRALVEQLLVQAASLGAVRLRACIDAADETLIALLASASTHPTVCRDEQQRVVVELPVQIPV